ncbi:MAG: ATP-binding protein [Candidatus Syntrophosphaera sp.]|nr:ATP-binding protein [Candidatus Syntrophosphaera sp.]
MIIDRVYDNLGDRLVKNKVMLLFGPRQVGKTTLVRRYYDLHPGKKLFLNGDDIVVQTTMASQDQAGILGRVEGYELLIIDEAQRIPNIGLALKILADNRQDLEIIATGSSSFDLMGQLGEPLTGRKTSLLLYPVWVGELLEHHNRFELDAMLPQLLIYGMYPEIVTASGKQRKTDQLNEITNSYLLKDILELDKVRSAQPVIDLLRLLAFQIGHEVSQNELGKQLGLDHKTVARYLDLFEKSHILIRLGGFSRNLRNEITSKAKYYFYDNGIRNSLIANFNPLELRNDIGMLWENFIITERVKKRAYHSIHANHYFWRTWDQQEIDLIEEREGKLFAYEIKWKKDKFKIPRKFQEAYPGSEITLVNRKNYLELIL